MDQTVNISSRLKELDNIVEYVNNTEKHFIETLHSMDWSPKGIEKLEFLLQCPINKLHTVPESKIRHHTSKCIQMGEHTSQDCLSSNMSKCLTDILRCTHSREERLAMYDDIIAKTPSSDSSYIPVLIDNLEGKNTIHKTYLEELALMRDLKRRRSKYKVSTKSKTYTEVIREVIKNQMDLYSEHLDERKYKTDSTLQSQSKSHMNESIGNIGRNKSKASILNRVRRKEMFNTKNIKTNRTSKLSTEYLSKRDY